MPLTMTDQAREQLKTIIKRQQNEAVGLRVYVTPGGCSGFSYGMSLDEEPGEDDVIQTIEGVRVVVDPFSMQYLEGAQIDYSDSLMGGGFQVLNPNATKSCACGQSFDTAASAGQPKACH